MTLIVVRMLRCSSEIGLPDKDGWLDTLHIYMAHMRKNKLYISMCWQRKCTTTMS